MDLRPSGADGQVLPVHEVLHEFRMSPLSTLIVPHPPKKKNKSSLGHGPHALSVRFRARGRRKKGLARVARVLRFRIQLCQIREFRLSKHPPTLPPLGSTWLVLPKLSFAPDLFLNRIHSFPRPLDEHLHSLDAIVHRAHLCLHPCLADARVVKRKPANGCVDADVFTHEFLGDQTISDLSKIILL